jgi:hypothetical protein
VIDFHKVALLSSDDWIDVSGLFVRTFLGGSGLGEPGLALLGVDVLVHELAWAGAGLDLAPALWEWALGLLSLLSLALLKGSLVAALDLLGVEVLGGSLTDCCEFQKEDPVRSLTILKETLLLEQSVNR